MTSVLRSSVDLSSDACARNRAAQLEALSELDAQLVLAKAGGGPDYADRHHARGRLLARERIELLLDRDAPFLELSTLAGVGHRVHGRAPASSPASAWCRGVECVIIAHDPTVRGGAMNPYTLQEDPARAGDRPASTGCR